MLNHSKEIPPADSKVLELATIPFIIEIKSLAIDIKSEKGREIIFKMVETADVLIENFGPETMERLGFGYEVLSIINSTLVYYSLKGFLTRPYEKRHAMDEVVQMMGGLTYMTGPVG